MAMTDQKPPFSVVMLDKIAMIKEERAKFRSLPVKEQEKLILEEMLKPDPDLTKLLVLWGVSHIEMSTIWMEYKNAESNKTAEA